jgi:hypothetical protein
VVATSLGESVIVNLDDAYGGFTIDHGNPTIFLCPILFDRRIVSENSIVLFTAIVLIHEIGHALKYPNTHSSTPPSALFREYRKGELNRTTYNGGHFIEHLLIGGELHLSEDLSKTFIVTSGGENREIDDQVIDYVLEHQSVCLLHVISETAVGEPIIMDQKRFKVTSSLDSADVSLPFKHKVFMFDDDTKHTSAKSEKDIIIIQSPLIVPVRKRRCIKLIRTKDEEQTMKLEANWSS